MQSQTSESRAIVTAAFAILLLTALQARLEPEGLEFEPTYMAARLGKAIFVGFDQSEFERLFQKGSGFFSTVFETYADSGEFRRYVDTVSAALILHIEAREDETLEQISMLYSIFPKLLSELSGNQV